MNDRNQHDDDLHANRVLEVAAGRTTEACDKLLETLTEEQRAKITEVSMDRWQALMRSAKKIAPKAETLVEAGDDHQLAFSLKLIHAQRRNL